MAKSNRDLFLELQAQTSPFPVGLEVERAKGVYIYTTDGKKYLDLVAGIAVSNLGHGHPKVLQAIHEQAEKYLHVMVYGEYIQQPQARLVSKLCSLLPENLNSVYLVNSGTEATEGSLKLAKRVTGRTGLVACKGSYHGSTHGSLSVTGNETKKYAFRPLLPDVQFITFNDPASLDLITNKTAGVIVETVQGDAGVRIPQKAWLQALRKRCDETGALLILDEIQCGMGRSGSWFAFQQFGIEPDILTLGKALGAGMPIGAFVASQERMKLLTSDPMLGHITTFGGHPLISAAALAGLEALEQEKIIDEVSRKGALFHELLQHPSVMEIRGIGLMLALDLGNPEKVNQLFDYCLNRGLVGFWFLSNPQSYRIAPPLIITEAEIRWACKIIVDGLEHIQGK